MTEKYESKQVRLRRPAADIYSALSDFNNFTPLVAGRVDDWVVNGDAVSFRVKGLSVGLRMAEKIPAELIKIETADGSPFGFTFWVQMKQVSSDDTRLRLVLHAEMNMMIKMMVGSKIQPALDSLADHISNFA